MLRSDFTSLPEWGRIVSFINAQLDEMKLAPLESVQHASVEKSAMMTAYCAGFVDALNSVLSLPDKLFSDGERVEEKLDEVLLNRPHPTRIF